MITIRRITFLFLWILCISLCAISASVGALSYTYEMWAGWVGRNEASILAQDGSFVLEVGGGSESFGPTEWNVGVAKNAEINPLFDAFRPPTVLGFSVGRCPPGTSPSVSALWYVAVPFWFIAVVLLWVSILVLRKRKSLLAVGFPVEGDAKRTKV